MHRIARTGLKKKLTIKSFCGRWWKGVYTHFCGLPTCIFYNPTVFFFVFSYRNGLLPVFIFYGLKGFLLFNRGLPIPLALSTRVVAFVRTAVNTCHGSSYFAQQRLPSANPNSVPITVFLLLLLFCFIFIIRIYVYMLILCRLGIFFDGTETANSQGTRRHA